MIFFRLISFLLRVFTSFFFVFFLQIQISGKTLESYLNNFGKTFIITESLQTVSQDGVKFIRDFFSKEQEVKLRKLTNSAKAKPIVDFVKNMRVEKKEDLKNKKQKEIEQSK